MAIRLAGIRRLSVHIQQIDFCLFRRCAHYTFGVSYQNIKLLVARYLVFYSDIHSLIINFLYVFTGSDVFITEFY